MKRVLITAFAAVVGLGLMAHDAEAKRLGGGMSSGMKRDSSVMKREAIPAKPAAPTAAPAPANTAQPAPARSGMSRWMGPIAGLAAGLGIAALLSHFGMGEMASNFLMIALLAMAAVFVLRMLFKKRAPQSPLQYAGAGNNARHQDTMQFHAGYEAANPAAQAATSGTAANAAPADFDVEGFVRQAKLNFVRMQAANDAGNMDDIRNFTTPEMFAEIQLQFQERNRGTQQTDVVQLNADLLDVSEQGSNNIASLRFHGLIRESAEANTELFDEVWHLIRPLDGSKGWTVAGIQQS